MDTSAIYIKMCEKATEIQDRKPRGVVCVGEIIAGPKTRAVLIYNGRYRFPDDIIWLLRQDQLQEMIPLASECHRVCDKLYGFADWVKTKAPYETAYCSLEQLWLAFVMHENHGKVWNGEEWVKEP